MTAGAVWLLHGLVDGKAGRGFGTLEGLQVAPILAWVLLLVWALYRPLLAAPPPPGSAEPLVPLEATWFGWGVRWAPLLVPWALPAIFATSVPVTAGVGLAAIVVEVIALEWSWRRRTPQVPVDRVFDRYRVRWDSGLFAAALVAGGLIVAIRDGGEGIVDIALIGGMFVIIAMYMRVYDAFQRDRGLPTGLSVGGLASAAFALGPLAGAQLDSSRPVLAAIVSVGGAAAFIASTEWHRRAAIRWHRGGQQART